MKQSILAELGTAVHLENIRFVSGILLETFSAFKKITHPYSEHTN